MIPLVNTKVARQPSCVQQSWWRGPVRWVVAVLALMAAADAVYLTWTSFSHSVVAGCDGISIANCDLVLSSSWSRWLFVPVALGGALCYVGVFVLSLFAGRLSDEADRWAGTLLVMLALLAAAAGLWFTFIQFFAVGAICLYCIATHLCGLVIACLVMWMAISGRPNSSTTSQSLPGLAAVPGAGSRRPTTTRASRGPSLGIAAGGAAVMFAMLVAGQILFPPQTYSASKPNLDQSVDMTAADDAPGASTDEISPTAHTHVVNRVSDAEGAAETAVAPEADEPTENSTTPDAAASSIAGTDSAAEKSTTESNDEAKADEAPALVREAKFLNDRVKINMYKEAILGSPEAPHVIIELMDYTCPHCREMHKVIKKARDRYGDQLAIVIMPVPLEMECNKMVTVTDPMHRGACRMSRQSLSVAKLDPEGYADFHNWLLADEKNPPSAFQTLERAWRSVDQGELSMLSNSAEMKKRIQQYIKLYKVLSEKYSTGSKPFGLPVQIVGDTVFTGKFESNEAMYEAWEKALGMKPD